jgi:DNA-binding XRE family transcriptional regulator
MSVLIGSADIRRRAAVPVVVTAEQVTVAREHAGKTLAMWRRAAGVTQDVLAGWSASSRSTVADVEQGRPNAPAEFWQRCDTALDAHGRVLTAAEHADRVAQLRRGQVVADAQRRRDRGWRGAADPRSGGAWRIPVGTGWPP